MKTKIDNENLIPYVGQLVSVYCQVGTVFCLTGKLVKDFGFCRYAIELSTGSKIGFSFGTFTKDETGIINIAIA